MGLEIHVECYAGYRGEETPRTIQFGLRRVQVKTVLDRWLSPDHRYFKVLCDDDSIYIIRHDTLSRTWVLTFFKQKDLPPGTHIHDE